MSMSKFATVAEYYTHIDQVNAELLEALELAVRQNSHDMIMTGDELRKCEAAIAKARGGV